SFPRMAGWRPISSTACRKRWATRHRRRCRAPNLPPSASKSQSNPPVAVRTPAPDAAASAGSRPSAGSPFKLGDPLSLDHMSSSATQKAVIDPRAQEQSKEVKGLEEILHNQAHPANLVAVKKSSTPVL